MNAFWLRLNLTQATRRRSRGALARTLICWTCLAGLLPFDGRADEPENSPDGPATPEYWAYRPVVRPVPPQVRNPERLNNPIDAFVAVRLEQQGLGLSPEARRHELIRRVKLDLLGLPPTPEEIARFENDPAPDAYEQLVERLLASPHYGERWARVWLDVVRYADTAGYNADPLRPLAYKYRDYVIQAFNDDRPYDRFVLEQLAGDELFPDDPSAWIATGFNRMPADESNASDVLLARQDNLNDLTAGVGAIFLGQSLGCAQCHDHKFDPISQRDYYRLQAFFAPLIPVNGVPVASAAESDGYLARRRQWLNATDDIRTELHRMEAAARAASWNEKRQRFPEIVWQALDTPPERRTAFQNQLCFFAERQIEVAEKAVLAAMTPEQQERRKHLQAELERRRASAPPDLPVLTAMAVADGADTPPTYRLAGGSYTKPQEEVQPGFLSALAAGTSAEVAATITAPRAGTTGRRTALARWLTDPGHPLTARVFVNRLWQAHFGTGLVKNANDFGVQTPPPSHPELLDWLAAELVAGGSPGHAWNVKRLHRLILLSAVYRQASDREIAGAAAPPGRRVDPANALYWHFPRRRLDAESLRDSLLAVSDQLTPVLYGPAVRPELPPNVVARDWTVSPTAAERQRRSIYILAKRNMPFPLLQAFDLPDMHESCACRQLTTTGPQALALLNSDTVLDFAQGFASRLLRDNPHGEPDRLIREAGLIAFARQPQPEEIREAAAFLARQQALVALRLAAGEQVLLPRGMPKFLDPSRAAAIVDFCHALLNANEFLYVD